MKTALQLWSIRDGLFDNLEETLAAVKAMGYDGVEVCNFGEGTVVKEIEAALKVGLVPFSIHIGPGDLANPNEELMALASKAGCRYMPIGALHEDRLHGGENCEETMNNIRKYAEIAKKYDIKVCYHNHDFDFNMVDGKHLIDHLYADLPADVLGAELDTCWVYTGGEDPLDYLVRYGDRCPILHLKDCVKEGGRKGFLEVGYGVIDFPPIFAKAKELGVDWLCVEQDWPSPDKTAMECAKNSIDYIKANI